MAASKAGDGKRITCIIGPDGVLVDGSFTTHVRGSDAGKSIIPDEGDDEERILIPQVVTMTEQDEDAVWTKDNRDQQGRERNRSATMKLIELYRKYKEVMVDKNVLKKYVWDEIAREMQKAGFNVTGMKCHQKWRNLERDYRSWVFWLSDSGGRMRKSPPECLEELHEIFENRRLASNHLEMNHVNGDVGREVQVIPDTGVTIKDSITTEPEEIIYSDSLTLECGSESESSHLSAGTLPKSTAKPHSAKMRTLSTQKAAENGFSEVTVEPPDPGKNRKRLKRNATSLPREPSDLDYIIDAIQEMREQESLELNQRFESLQNLLERHHRERMECMYELIEAISGKKKKKRLRDEPDSPSSSEG